MNLILLDPPQDEIATFVMLIRQRCYPGCNCT